jgi:hypothetical protein
MQEDIKYRTLSKIGEIPHPVRRNARKRRK